ncbi:MAG TPA: ribonuclease III [Spirochaetota bacterium]|nr:ribonuclease III [Spirochaetota bacterium]HOM38816.1 ribonuclease III [Spirochaetota bacterium]HPQ49874.1 ribonuclease III [Spirochaetota bacterium]
MKKEITDFLNSLGLNLKNIENIEKAFTHSSYANRMNCESNERLEFLGDSVLSLCISTILYGRYKYLEEGELTKIRAYIVSEKTLSDIAKKIGIDKLLIISYGEESCGGRENPANLADAFEAFLAAVFLETGFENTKNFVEDLFVELIEEIKDQNFISDYKTEFQYFIQKKYKKTPYYKIIREEGPPHKKVFYSALCFESREISIGIGKTKKNAEQDAARKALEMIKCGKIDI